VGKGKEEIRCQGDKEGRGGKWLMYVVYFGVGKKKGSGDAGMKHGTEGFFCFHRFAFTEKMLRMKHGKQVFNLFCFFILKGCHNKVRSKTELCTQAHRIVT
jgi:hypothetical protein